MIRINLAGQSNSKSGVSFNPQDNAEIFISTELLRKEALKRLLVLLVVPVGLYFYEQQTIPQMRAQVDQLRAQYEELYNYNESSKEIVDRIEKLKVTDKIFRERLDAIDRLRKYRFKEVRIMDMVQASIVETAWLKEIDMKSGFIKMSGFAMSDVDISKFVEDLNQSRHIQEVRLMGTSDQSLDGTVVKKFEVECLMEGPSKTTENL